ncbi:MAG: Bax inhibitor-1/YccA family protein [Spirochaetales bacterium]|jgi:FtsH-binding integral membrane protein|nr:Bax inhibitor-1/YccA family protein [Spirochaetales bacterium]
MAEQNYTLTAAEVRERSVLKNVYIWMAAGLALTGIVAYGVATNPRLLASIFSSSFTFFGIIIAEFALVFFLSSRIMTMSVSMATICFAAYAALNGVTMSLIFLVYTSSSIAQVFFITAGTFAGMSVYAVTTRRDLSRIGSYLVMALIGLIVASLVNMFLKSSSFDWLISVVGVLVFVGLTAYDTQRIKKWSAQAGGSGDEALFVRMSILGALHLYLDFVNLFLYLLRLFGKRR